MTLFHELPAPVLLTTAGGLIVDANVAFTKMVGLPVECIQQTAFEKLLPPASQIFMQTHVWPLLLRNNCINEIYLKVKGPQNGRVPVLVNCSKCDRDGHDRFLWVFMVALERSKFEEELLVARKRVEATNLSLTKNERFIKTVTDAIPGLVAYIDSNEFCRFANKTCREWFGIPDGSLEGLHLKDFMDEEMYRTSEPYRIGVLANEPQQFQRTIISPDGTSYQTLTSYIPDVSPEGEVIGFFVLSSDVSVLKAAEVQLKLADSVFNNTIEGIMVTNGEGIILSVNPAFTSITGFSAQEALGKTPRILKSGRYEQDEFADLWKEIVATGRWEGETWNCHKNGDAFLARQSITAIQSDSDQAVRYVTVFNDITDRWQREEHIRHLAFHDPLTHLPNRAHLMEKLGQLISGTTRQRKDVALMFLDLDGFKAINDNHGHESGDAALQIVAQKLQHVRRASDTVGRLGGDEFILLIDSPLDVEEVAHIANRIIAAIGEPMVYRGATLQLGVSIGIAVFPDDGRNAEQLIKHADHAMYSAKQAGKNTFRFHNNEIFSV